MAPVVVPSQHEKVNRPLASSHWPTGGRVAGLQGQKAPLKLPLQNLRVPLTQPQSCMNSQDCWDFQSCTPSCASFTAYPLSCMAIPRRGEDIFALYYDRGGPPVWSYQSVLYLLVLTPMGARCNTLECDKGRRREEPARVNRYQFVCVSAVTNAIVPVRRALALFPQLWPLRITNTTAVLCAHVRGGVWALRVHGHVHSLAARLLVYCRREGGRDVAKMRVLQRLYVI